MLSVDKDSLLKMDSLPTKSNDTARFDVDAFDVPIVKLDEWMEGNILEEISEEWLLKPKFVEEIEEQVVSPMRRKRRRGGRGGGTEETSPNQREYTSEQSFDDLGMNVVFRKRD
jgi:hypothetical protein